MTATSKGAALEQKLMVARAQRPPPIEGPPSARSQRAWPAIPRRKNKRGRVDADQGDTSRAEAEDTPLPAKGSTSKPLLPPPSAVQIWFEQLDAQALRDFTQRLVRLCAELDEASNGAASSGVEESMLRGRTFTSIVARATAPPDIPPTRPAELLSPFAAGSALSEGGGSGAVGGIGPWEATTLLEDSWTWTVPDWSLPWDGSAMDDADDAGAGGGADDGAVSWRPYQQWQPYQQSIHHGAGGHPLHSRRGPASRRGEDDAHEERRPPQRRSLVYDESFDVEPSYRAGVGGGGATPAPVRRGDFGAPPPSSSDASGGSDSAAFGTEVASRLDVTTPRSFRPPPSQRAGGGASLVPPAGPPPSLNASFGGAEAADGDARGGAAVLDLAAAAVSAESERARANGGGSSGRRKAPGPKRKGGAATPKGAAGGSGGKGKARGSGGGSGAAASAGAGAGGASSSDSPAGWVTTPVGGWGEYPPSNGGTEDAEGGPLQMGRDVESLPPRAGGYVSHRGAPPTSGGQSNVKGGDNGGGGGSSDARTQDRNGARQGGGSSAAHKRHTALSPPAPPRFSPPSAMRAGQHSPKSNANSPSRGGGGGGGGASASHAISPSPLGALVWSAADEVDEHRRLQRAGGDGTAAPSGAMTPPEEVVLQMSARGRGGANAASAAAGVVANADGGGGGGGGGGGDNEVHHRRSTAPVRRGLLGSLMERRVAEAAASGGDPSSSAAAAVSGGDGTSPRPMHGHAAARQQLPSHMDGGSPLEQPSHAPPRDEEPISQRRAVAANTAATDAAVVAALAPTMGLTLATLPDGMLEEHVKQMTPKGGVPSLRSHRAGGSGSGGGGGGGASRLPFPMIASHHSSPPLGEASTSGGAADDANARPRSPLRRLTASGDDTDGASVYDDAGLEALETRSVFTTHPRSAPPSDAGWSDLDGDGADDAMETRSMLTTYPRSAPGSQSDDADDLDTGELAAELAGLGVGGAAATAAGARAAPPPRTLSPVPFLAAPPPRPAWTSVRSRSGRWIRRVTRRATSRRRSVAAAAAAALAAVAGRWPSMSPARAPPSFLPNPQSYSSGLAPGRAAAPRRGRRRRRARRAAVDAGARGGAAGGRGGGGARARGEFFHRSCGDGERRPRARRPRHWRPCPAARLLRLQQRRR